MKELHALRTELESAVRPGHEQVVEMVRALNIPAYFNGSGRGILPPGVTPVSGVTATPARSA